MPPNAAEVLGVSVHHDKREGLSGVDIVMMLRLQTERMQGTFVPSTREYFHFWGLDAGNAPGTSTRPPPTSSRARWIT